MTNLGICRDVNVYPVPTGMGRCLSDCHKVAFFKMFDEVWRCHIAQLTISVDSYSCVLELTRDCPFCDGSCYKQ